ANLVPSSHFVYKMATSGSLWNCSIITDRGTAVTSRSFEDFCKSKAIHHTLNSSQHPHGNGQVECVNRFLSPMLAISSASSTNKDWDKYLRTIQRDINAVPSKTTNQSPFVLLHG